jgi:hypothetical protein
MEDRYFQNGTDAVIAYYVNCWIDDNIAGLERLGIAPWKTVQFKKK